MDLNRGSVILIRIFYPGDKRGKNEALEYFLLSLSSIAGLKFTWAFQPNISLSGFLFALLPPSFVSEQNGEASERAKRESCVQKASFLALLGSVFYFQSFASTNWWQFHPFVARFFSEISGFASYCCSLAFDEAYVTRTTVNLEITFSYCTMIFVSCLVTLQIITICCKELNWCNCYTEISVKAPILSLAPMVYFLKKGKPDNSFSPIFFLAVPTAVIRRQPLRARQPAERNLSAALSTSWKLALRRKKGG